MKRIILNLVLGLLLSTMVSCTTQGDDYRVKNPTQAPTTVTLDPNWTSEPIPTDSSDELVTDNPYGYLQYINPDRLFNIGEWFDNHDVFFRINSVEIHTDLERVNTEKIYEGFLSGIKAGKAWFFVIEMDIRNEKEEPVEVCLGVIQGWEQHKDQGSTFTNFEYCEPAMYEGVNANYYLLQPGEEVHFTLIEASNCDSKVLEDTYYVKIPNYVYLPRPDPNELFYNTNAYVVVNKDKSEVDVYE